MFTVSADGGICAECRPAESLLRQTQAGGRADARRELLVVVQLWPWRRLWRTSGCQSTAGGEQGETRNSKERADDEDRPQPAQEMGPRGQDHTYPSGTRECDSATAGSGWSRCVVGQLGLYWFCIRPRCFRNGPRGRGGASVWLSDSHFVLNDGMFFLFLFLKLACTL